MRRFFLVFAALCTVIVLGVGGLMGYVAYRGSALDAEGQAYVDQALADIGKRWDVDDLITRASPALMSHASRSQLDAMFQRLARFGGLVHCDTAKGSTSTFVSIGGASTFRAHYEADARFQNGPLHFRVDLTKLNGKWMIDGFHVDAGAGPTKPADARI